MRLHRIRHVHVIIVWLKRGLAGLVSVIGLILRANVETWEPWHRGLLATPTEFIQSWAWIAITVAMALIWILEVARRMVGDPRTWAVVDVVLDELRDQLFEDSKDEPLHSHRVTLFKRVRWACRRGQCPWGGWLKPAARSGHTTQRSSIRFKAPDDSDRAEGIAGMAWGTRGKVYIRNLPSLSEDSSDEDVRSYAKKSFMDLREVRKRKGRLKARSFCGCPVEVAGKVWGSIVVDSRNPEVEKSKFDEHYRFTARVLGKTLEGR